MKLERLAELRTDAEKALEQGEGYHPHVGARDLLALVDLAEWAVLKKEDNRRRVAAVRQSKHAGGEKTPQNARKAPKKPSPAIEAAHTVEEVQAQLAKFKVVAQIPDVAEGESLHRQAFESKHVMPVPAPKPAAKPKPKPAEESALHPAFQSVLFSRVKTPAQLKHDPTATQFKAAKAKKGNS